MRSLISFTRSTGTENTWIQRLCGPVNLPANHQYIASWLFVSQHTGVSNWFNIPANMAIHDLQAGAHISFEWKGNLKVT